MTGLGAMRLSDAMVLVSLAALCFPALALIRLGDGLVFPHYIALALAMPLLLLLRPLTIAPALPVIAMIVLSSLLNAYTVALPIAVFHSLHLAAAALLASCPAPLALRFAKATLLIYAVTILLTQVLVAVGLHGLVEGLLVQQEGLTNTRVSSFATEPSYASMIMLILTRFVLVTNVNWLTLRRLALILGALLASLSLFALISAILILAMYLLERGATRAALGGLLSGVVMLVGLSFTDFFLLRLTALDLSQGALGLGTGTIRLLPYIYMFDILPENPWPLLVGAGAGALEPGFFEEVGQYATSANQLSTQMAGPIYDYGLPTILIILLVWNRPKGLAARALFILMSLVIMMNTGLGTYLFVLFGTFALLEQRLKSS